MIVFGWLCLTLLAAFASFGSIAAALGSIGLTGKLGGECLFLLAIAAALVWASYANFPFTVTVTP